MYCSTIAGSLSYEKYYTFKREDISAGFQENTLSFIEYSKLYSSGWPFTEVDQITSRSNENY